MRGRPLAHSRPRRRAVAPSRRRAVGALYVNPIRRYTMFDRILSTQPSRTLFAQRCMLALVMVPHGAQKALGLFGGYGMRATMAYFTGTLGIPAPVAFLVIIA